MKHRRIRTSALIAAGLLAGLSQASANNVTIADWNTTTTWEFGGGGSDPAGEDNEIEYAAWRNQYWDLEAFSYNKNTQTLYLIGGYEFEQGYGSGYNPGDLFIKVGGALPSGAPTLPTSGTIDNDYNFTYAVKLSGDTPGNLTGSVGVQTLSSTTQLSTVSADNRGGNPWKVANFQQNEGTVNVVYHKGKNSTYVNNLTGVAGLVGDSDGSAPGANVEADGVGHTLGGYNDHNIVEINLFGTQLGNLLAGETFWLSYTMECGNDSIKGHVPDGGTTLMLLGSALSGLCLFGRRMRKA